MTNIEKVKSWMRNRWGIKKPRVDVDPHDSNHIMAHHVMNAASKKAYGHGKFFRAIAPFLMKDPNARTKKQPDWLDALVNKETKADKARHKAFRASERNQRRSVFKSS